MRRGQSYAELLERERAEQERKANEKRDPRVELRERLREAIAVKDEHLDHRIRQAGACFYRLCKLQQSTTLYWIITMNNKYSYIIRILFLTLFNP